MAARTDAELLEDVVNAIHTILVGGKSYQIDGRSLTRADLPELRSLRSELEMRINSAAGTSRNKSNLACFKRPT